MHDVTLCYLYMLYLHYQYVVSYSRLNVLTDLPFLVFSLSINYNRIAESKLAGRWRYSGAE